MQGRIDPAFGEDVLRSVADPAAFGPHRVFNRFWEVAPDEVIGWYAAAIQADEELRRHLEVIDLRDPLPFDALRACPEGSLGRATATFLETHRLDPSLAPTYRAWHEELEAEGRLDRMPPVLRHVVLRAFQLHDYIHVLTGLPPTPGGEMAVHAFCLAQMRFTYFALALSLSAAHATLVAPERIELVMDAVSEGWSFGRRVRNVQLVRWEDRVHEPLPALRAEHGIHPDGGRPLDGVSARA